jgi:hypothetical protein
MKKDIEITIGEDTYNIGEMTDTYNNLHNKMREVWEDMNKLYRDMEIDDREDSQRNLKRIINKLG